MKKYKNLILDGIMKIFLCIIFHFHHEKKQEGKFSPSGQHKMAWNTFQNIQCKLWWNFYSFLSPCPPWNMWWASWITVSQSLVISCWQTKFLSNWENFGFFPILMTKVKYEIKQICTILYLYFWEFVKSFHPPNLRK